MIWNILWAKQETFLWLTGLWDLVFTCSSNESRNFQAWFQIWKNNSAKEFLTNNQTTVEGLNTILSIEKISKKFKLDLPILHSLYLIIYKNEKPSEMVNKIMKRPLKKE